MCRVFYCEGQGSGYAEKWTSVSPCVEAKIVHYDPAAVLEGAGVDVKKAFPFRPIHFYSYPARAYTRSLLSSI